MKAQASGGPSHTNNYLELRESRLGCIGLPLVFWCNGLPGLEHLHYLHMECGIRIGTSGGHYRHEQRMVGGAAQES